MAAFGGAQHSQQLNIRMEGLKEESCANISCSVVGNRSGTGMNQLRGVERHEEKKEEELGDKWEVMYNTRRKMLHGLSVGNRV